LQKVEAVVYVTIQHVTETAGEHKRDAWKTPTDVLPERALFPPRMTVKCASKATIKAG